MRFTITNNQAPPSLTRRTQAAHIHTFAQWKLKTIQPGRGFCGFFFCSFPLFDMQRDLKRIFHPPNLLSMQTKGDWSLATLTILDGFEGGRRVCKLQLQMTKHLCGLRCGWTETTTQIGHYSFSLFENPNDHSAVQQTPRSDYHCLHRVKTRIQVRETMLCDSVIGSGWTIFCFRAE